MSKFNAYKRIVVFQPRNAWVCDLGPGNALAPRFQQGDEYFGSAAGTREAVARTRGLTIPVFDDARLKHLRTMQNEGCELRAICIGGGSHIVWEYDSAPNLVPFGGGPAQLSGANLELNTDVFECSIYQNEDLLAGVPWECKTATADGGTIYFPGPQGFLGNRWIAASGQSTDEDGALTGVGSPSLTMFFPLEGLKFNLGGNFTGSLKTLDFSGSTLSTTTKSVSGTDVTGTIDSGTWKIEIEVTAASGRPVLTVTDAGSQSANRPGGCIDCSDLTAELSTAPGWSS